MAEGRVSVTPIHFDLTDHGGIERLRGWGFEEMLAACPRGVSEAAAAGGGAAASSSSSTTTATTSSTTR